MDSWEKDVCSITGGNNEVQHEMDGWEGTCMLRGWSKQSCKKKKLSWENE
jgi:hypothetical protein